MIKVNQLLPDVHGNIIFGGYEVSKDDLITGFEEEDIELSELIQETVRRCLKKVYKRGAAFAVFDDTVNLATLILRRLVEKYAYFDIFTQEDDYVVFLIDASHKNVSVKTPNFA